MRQVMRGERGTRGRRRARRRRFSGEGFGLCRWQVSRWELDPIGKRLTSRLSLRFTRRNRNGGGGRPNRARSSRCVHLDEVRVVRSNVFPVRCEKVEFELGGGAYAVGSEDVTTP